MRTLLIDNYDSFTFNLYQAIAEVSGQVPLVVKNDAISMAEIERLDPDNIILSPGPGRPERVRDFGVCADVLRQTDIPVLGVCLGMQGLAWAFGGAVTWAPEPMHGRSSSIRHADDPLFAGLPDPFRAVRYHSLCVESDLPDCLRAIAWSDDGVIMALRHIAKPFWGVQFHPESVATEHGHQLIRNFLNLTRDHHRSAGRAIPDTMPGAWQSQGRRQSPPPDDALVVSFRRLDLWRDPERVFVELYGTKPDAF
ncbi:MAG: aminodeoxychorismate/anthranilate synthase component II, partial [Verrucomicrobia bacterium]|nr:aminodeoxychorismate/anthranilate synthase component II [Verrucomicrobiota bacterium]